MLVKWGHKWSGHSDRDGGYLGAKKHELPLSSVDLATATSDCLVCQQQRPMLGPQYDTIAWKDEPVIWWRVAFTGPLYPEGVSKSWLKSIHILNTDLPFLPAGWQSATLVQDLRIGLIYQHGILYNIASDQKTHFTAKEVQQWANEHRIPITFCTTQKLLAWDM